MATWGKESQLPKEALIYNSAVPVFTSAGDPANLFVSGMTDIVRLDLENSTSATILFTMTDASGNHVANWSNVPIDPNTPQDYQFPANGQRMLGGVRMYAVSAGLYVNMTGFTTGKISGVLSAYR